MKGWNGKILRVDLTKRTTEVTPYSEDIAKRFIGGRGLAVKLLWEELPQGADPLGSENMLIFATGPYTAFNIPNSGKMVIAAKSPLTGGYGDGNIGTRAATHMRKCGIDAVVVTGKADKPVYLYVEDDKVEIYDAGHLWGKDSYVAEDWLLDKHGKASGTLLIGQSGENKCMYATVVSQKGRAGGRPAMGAVMGSKNLKAAVFKGSKEIPAADPEKLKELGRTGFAKIPKFDAFPYWKKVGTMMAADMMQTASALPTRNFSEGVFEHIDKVNGDAVHAATVTQRGCPNCNMICGNTIIDSEGKESELDYENVTMLGSNIGLGNLKQIGTLNRICDELGLDTIGAGNGIGFAMECSEKGLIDLDIKWGDFEGAKKLLYEMAMMEGHGALIGLGTKVAAEKIGGIAPSLAIHAKGLEVSAYDCHVCPGMALSFGTSPIGAHHKDAWVISWEISSGIREEYGPEKADKVIEFQRIRGGMFETLVSCRFPWIELGYELEEYPLYMEAATGVKMTLDDMWKMGDRVYALVRAFWAREYGEKWSRLMDYPPEKWFKYPLTEGALAGKKLDKDKYDKLLSVYYEKRGWDERGIPTKATMKDLDLSEEAKQLAKYVELE
ncbi:MAG: aldehyde ferredoxin oxidoreductase family protein [Candidatus Bathyarchaeota archaeon]|nr:aldehyde ferredoxin oxidoreductase family protein [Candidatus Bathyarchaeota archaeon]